MTIKTSIKADGGESNHNETQVQPAAKPEQAPASSGLKIKTKMKAGGSQYNHNETLLAAR